MILYEKISAQLPEWRERINKLAKDNGDMKIGEVSVGQVLGGMRGVNSLVSDISYVDPYKGVLFRGFPIPELLEKLPKLEGHEFPMAGGLYYMLLIGEVPTMDEALEVECEWKRRSEIPQYVFDTLRAMSPASHPMTMFSTAILSMQPESIFAKRYEEGMHKLNYWEATLEDSLNLTAKLPALAAFIYNLRYKDGRYIPPNPDLDWSANFAHMIGKADDKEYQELCRLFFVLHADHESANVSAHTAHIVGSALSNVYASCSAGMSGLAGPLHGLANQGCLRWLMRLRERFGGLPTREELEKFSWETLNSGQVIPGYGHAVLRRTDPRFLAQYNFAKKHMPDDELFQLVDLVYEVVPRVLAELGKVSNPWPNVDAITGTIQYHYGLRELKIYTVIFGVSRIMGITANTVWSRIFGLPIERPQSVTTGMLESAVRMFARS